MKDVIDFGPIPLESFPRKVTLLEELKSLSYQLDHDLGALILNSAIPKSENYWSISGITESHAMYLKDIAEEAIDTLKAPLYDDDVVLDIGCNDGTLLGAYPDTLRRVGIDPARKIRAIGCDLHIRELFSETVYMDEVGEKAKIITMIGVLPVVDDPLAFLKEAASVLEDKGLLVVEFPYYPKLLEKQAFDAFNFELKHLYSRKGFKKLCQKAGLTMTRSQIIGENIRCFVEKDGVSESVDDTLTCSLESLKSHIHTVKNDLISFLKKAKLEGKSVLGYGASGRGNTLLSICGIGADLLPAIADRNPVKWGRLTSTGIPIISEEEARSNNPDYFLALPYRYIDAFMKRERAFVLSGGKFIVPLPKLQELPEE